MKVIKGIIASPGLAIGNICIHEEIDYIKRVEDSCYTSDSIQEIKMLETAYKKLTKDLEYLQKTSPKEEKELIEAQKLMLEALVQETKELILNKKLCVATAVKRIYEKYDQLFSQSGSELINLRRSDLRSLATRIIMYLLGKDVTNVDIEEDAIIVAKDLSPLELMELKNRGVKGIITVIGGPTSHVAILARTYNIPYLIINNYIIQDLQNRKCILDCLNGSLIIDPDYSSYLYYKSIYEKYNKLLKEFIKSSRFIARTIDGFYVRVECNMGTIEDLRLLNDYGCDGIGLFRVEFMYMNRKKPPTENDLLRIFEKIANVIGEKKAIIRAPDLGADKPVEYVDFSTENNPQLGLRGIRLLLKYKDELLYPFIRAFMIANRNNNMKLLLPMITSVNEVLEVIKVVNQVLQDLRTSPGELDLPDLGVMIETPASIFILDQIIERTPISFISIGTNDLTQYILAVDRTNPRLSYMYNELHPSILRSLMQIIEIVSKAKRLVSIGVCGEMAGQTRAIPILLVLGIKELSVAPTFVGKVKYYISKLNISEIKDDILKVIKTSLSSEEIEDYIKKLYEKYKLQYIP